MPRIAARLLAVLMLLGVASPARAYILYDVFMGFYPANFFYDQDGGISPPYTVGGPYDFSYDGALCPPAGTPNYLCARARSTAGIRDGRIYLGTGVRMKRTDAQFTQDHGVYAGARVDIGPLSGYVSGPAPGAYFVFGLSGIISSTRTNANVAVNSFAVANLYAGSGGAVQCFGPTDCSPKSQQTLKVTNWDPAGGFSLALRSDVQMLNPTQVTGWDGEGEAEFYDTLELLAVQLVDADDHPIPGVTLTMTDGNGGTIVIPDTPPDPDATSTPTAAVTATPTPETTATPAVPVPTATPGCGNPPCEDCENCVDDDQNGLVDRADPACAPAANGGGLGLADPDAAKAADKCAKALRKVGTKLTRVKLAALQSCVNVVADCVQAKPGSASCLTGARAKCGKAKSGLASAEAKLTGALAKPCGEAAIAASALGLTTGLGFAAETAACERRGVASLATAADVAECLRRRHGCAVERLVGFSAPRAGELLTLGGWDVASELSCLPTTAIGGGVGIGTPKQKALRKCDRAIQKATVKLASGRTKAQHACVAAVFTCEQSKPADGDCLDKARGKCTGAVNALPTLAASFAAAIDKACAVTPIDIADLRAVEGLGVSALDAPCAALGLPTIATIGDLASCLGLELACRVDQLLESETPRLTELLEAGAD